MSRLVLFSVAVISIAMGGCAAKYVAPSTSSGNAAVSFSVKGEPALGYAAFLWMQNDPRNDSCFARGTRMAVISEKNPFLSTNNPGRIPISAGSQTTLQAVMVPANVLNQIGCTYNIRFVPEEWRTYRIEVSWQRELCTSEIMEQQADGQWAAVESASIVRLRC